MIAGGYRLQDARPPSQGASRYAATWYITSSDKGGDVGVMVHTQTRTLVLRVEGLPLFQSVRGVSLLSCGPWFAYPIPI